jgi:hypothetical protein
MEAAAPPSESVDFDLPDPSPPPSTREAADDSARVGPRIPASGSVQLSDGT